jgi:uncharacterized repeat protein (TIGR01451 family)
MKNNRFKTLLTSTIIAGSALMSTHSFAIGTDAGTAISNTATVSFTRGGSVDSEQASISFKVDEIINVNVTAANASSNITNGDQNVAITYTVTNTGNGTELFKLFDSINSSNNGLPLSASDLTVYVNTSQTPGAFDPNNASQQPYAGEDISITNDKFITVYIVTNVPNGAELDTKSELLITAISQTNANGVTAGNSSFGDVIAGAGENGTDAIIAVNNGQDNASSELLVTVFDPTKSLVVNITKTILGSTALISNAGTDIVTDQKIPGAVVSYFIKVSIENSGATALSISDIIPPDMTYIANSMRLQDASGSTINTPTYIAPSLPTAIPVTYSNFNALTDAADAADAAATSTDAAGRVQSITVNLGDLAIGEYALLLDATINN